MKSTLHMFQGTITKVNDHAKVIKVLLDDRVELLHFKGDPTQDTMGLVHNSAGKSDPLKDRHVPLFLRGAHLKATCAKFGDGNGWAIREVTITPPNGADARNATIWMEVVKGWMLSLKDARKPKDSTAPSLSKMSAVLLRHHTAFTNLVRHILDVLREGSGLTVLQTAIAMVGRVEGVYPEEVLDVCGHVWRRMQEVYDRAARFHKLKEDVVAAGYDGKITDADIAKAISYCADYGLFKKNPFETYKSKRAAKMAFAVLDMFAAMYGMTIEKRVVHTVWHCMQQIMGSDGHVCYDVEAVALMAWKHLKGRLMEDCRNDVEGAAFIKTVIEQHATTGTCRGAEPAKDFVIYKHDGVEWLYLGYVYGMEHYIAERCAEFSKAMKTDHPSMEEAEILSLIQSHEEQHRMAFHELQKAAMIRFLSHTPSMHVLTGLPGTGKSSVVKCLWDIAEQKRWRVITCAPTGKAANRLGGNASTIHRVLGTIYDEKKNRFSFMRNEGLPLEADLVIVDEVSMLDLQLCYYLFSALPKQVRVLFLGDENQLPSVNYGNVLQSWLESRSIPHTHLTKIFRQGDGSVISKLSKYVVKGAMPPPRYLQDGGPEVEYITLTDPMKIHRKVLELYLKCRKESCMILIPTKKGDVGTVAVNSTIHRYIFKEDAQEKVLKFRPGEKIVVVANSYTKDEDGEVIPEQSVYNGESGVFVEYKNKNTVVIDVEDKRVAVDKDAIDMGSSVTVHKSQGSEYDTIIIVLHDSHAIMLNKEVLYTGITRAKKKLYIIGSDACIAKCVSRKSPKRHDCLTVMIKK